MRNLTLLFLSACRYRLGRKIGSGSFGDIYIGTEPEPWPAPPLVGESMPDGVRPAPVSMELFLCATEAPASASLCHRAPSLHLAHVPLGPRWVL